MTHRHRNGDAPPPRKSPKRSKQGLAREQDLDEEGVNEQSSQDSVMNVLNRATMLTTEKLAGKHIDIEFPNLPLFTDVEEVKQELRSTVGSKDAHEKELEKAALASKSRDVLESIVNVTRVYKKLLRVRKSRLMQAKRK